MDDLAVSDFSLNLDTISIPGGGRELENAIKVLTKVDMDLAYSSEKLLNLHFLLMHLLALYDELDPRAVGNGYFKEDFLEKALRYDLLIGILDSEVREVDIFLATLPAEIDDAHHEISSCRHFQEVYTVMDEKLHKCRESLKQSREQALEVKRHIANLQKDFAAVQSDKSEKDNGLDLSDKNQLFNSSFRAKTKELPRYVSRMLEKSLAREQALEKKLSESRQNEEDLKWKLHYTEQVALHMEEAAEVVWGRFLEAENAWEILMGISKELVGKSQVIQFNLNSSVQREAQFLSKIEDLAEQLKAKDIIVQKLESVNVDYVAKCSEVVNLSNKVKVLEEQLKETRFHLKEANASWEASQNQIDEMEHVVETLKEGIEAAESKADAAEGKVTHLTDSNLELTEELNFLKGSVNSKTEKVSVLEKQSRELELQLQHARASSEASQEQQNLLYSAIWDMETLIEDLKSKVSKAESKTDSVEEQCIELSEANFELKKEVSLLRAKIRDLEMSLDDANSSKVAISDEVNLRTKIMMDTVMQLAFERERIQKQLYFLTKDDKMLVGKLKNVREESLNSISHDKDFNEREPPL